MLIAAVCDGHATEAQQIRLSKLLREDAEARQQYLQYVDLHAALAEEDLGLCAEEFVRPRAMSTISSKGDSVPAFDKRRSSVASASSWRWLLVTTALVAILIFGSTWLFTESTRKVAGTLEKPAPLKNHSVATMLLSEQCRWLATDLDEGQRLSPGRIVLQIGTAVLRFDGGAELVMVGPAAIDLKTAARVQVDHGDVIVRAESGAEGFVVTTPTSQVIDLGTEFAVKVRQSGATEVHVLDGEVSYRGINTADELARILRAGEGVAIDENGNPRAVAMDSPRFQEFVNRINPGTRADLLTVYEGFNYSPGTLPLEKSDVGIGWNSSWRHASLPFLTASSNEKSQSDFKIVHGEIRVAWPVPGGRLGMLELPPGPATFARELQSPISLDRDDVTYFSLMVHLKGDGGSLPPKHDSRSQVDRLYLIFGAPDNLNQSHVTFGYSNGRIPFVQLAGGAKFDSPVEMPRAGTSLWIGKIVSRRNGKDEVYLRVYSESDSLDYAEPTAWHIASHGTQLNGKLDRIILHTDGSHTRIIDELRIGPTWRSVAPITTSVPKEDAQE